MEASFYKPLELSEETKKIWERSPEQKAETALGGVCFIALSIIFMAGFCGVITGWTYSFLNGDWWMLVTPFCPALCLGTIAGSVNFIGLGVLFLWGSTKTHEFPKELRQETKDQLAKVLQNKSFETVQACVRDYIKDDCLVFNGLLSKEESDLLQVKIEEHRCISVTLQWLNRDPLNRAAPPQKLLEAQSQLESIETWWSKHQLLIFN